MKKIFKTGVILLTAVLLVASVYAAQTFRLQVNVNSRVNFKVIAGLDIDITGKVRGGTMNNDPDDPARDYFARTYDADYEKDLSQWQIGNVNFNAATPAIEYEFTFKNISQEAARIEFTSLGFTAVDGTDLTDILEFTGGLKSGEEGSEVYSGGVIELARLETAEFKFTLRLNRVFKILPATEIYFNISMSLAENPEEPPSQ